MHNCTHSRIDVSFNAQTQINDSKNNELDCDHVKEYRPEGNISGYCITKTWRSRKGMALEAISFFFAPARTQAIPNMRIESRDQHKVR